MLWSSISQIRHKTANRNNGIPNAASIVILADFPISFLPLITIFLRGVSGADALSDFIRAISLYGCILIAANFPFFKNSVNGGIFCLRDGSLRKKGHLHRRQPYYSYPKYTGYV